MGRHKKVNENADGVDRRESGYYSTPPFVARFISREMLKINPSGKTVLDPCVGKEELLEVFYEKGLAIDSFDRYPHRHRYDKSHFRQVDFIGYYRDLVSGSSAGGLPVDYDYIIANPPYNCHEIDFIRNNKPALNALFPGVGCFNMYSMFIAAMVEMAKEGAVIGFITYDSFLTSRMHAGLRKLLLERCSIHLLALCPASLFREQGADIRSCIMILQKGRRYQRRVSVVNRLPDCGSFERALQRGVFERKTVSEITLADPRDGAEFVAGVPDMLLELFARPRIGEMFRCFTGISTGNDAKYLFPSPGEGHTVPFYKNPGNRKFFTEPDAYLPDDFMEIARKVPNFIVRNREMLTKEGIICSSMGIGFGACYRPPDTTFGVNAGIGCGSDDLWWLLAYLNSSLVAYFVRGVLLRTNMITSGYVARIPVVALPAGVKRQLGELARTGGEKRHDKRSIRHTVAAIDGCIYTALALPERTRNLIDGFCGDILRLT